MFTIGAAARQTGISAATLRKWESRYGFPVPMRGAGDQRAFHASDVAALIEISRRIANGQRAGKAIRDVKGGTLQPQAAPLELAPTESPVVSRAIALLLQNDWTALEGCLSSHLAQNGASAFARDLAIPLIEMVGTLWQQGRLTVYAEHLFSAVLQKVVIRTSAPPTKSDHSAPRVLLASPAAEGHTLALVLLNAVLQEANIPTVFLQGGLPASEIAAAATAFHVQVVALSASVACPPRLLTTELRSLRAMLDNRVALWIGGRGTRRISTRIEGVTVITSIDAAVQALNNPCGCVANLAKTESEHNHG